MLGLRRVIEAQLNAPLDTVNTPAFWPGNFVWSNSANANLLGEPPGYIQYSADAGTTPSVRFFHSPPGMIKIPVDRSYIIKMGKHFILRHKSGSSDKWIAVVGPGL
ncbi:MAG: hypothetical protein ACKO96_19000, partial [Flammeovirgaceae bacterium]